MVCGSPGLSGRRCLSIIRVAYTWNPTVSRGSTVSAGCLRSTGAMALLCGGVDSSRIRLLGRWKIWTMLRYLHLQSRAAMCGLSAAMLQGGKIDMPPPGSPPSIFPEPPDVPACITPNYSEVYETL